jgi:hypothetical protein
MSFALDVFAKTSVLLICAAFVTGVRRRASASTRHAVWILAMAGTLLSPLVVAFAPASRMAGVLPYANTTAVSLPVQSLTLTFRRVHKPLKRKGKGTKGPRGKGKVLTSPFAPWTL